MIAFYALGGGWGHFTRIKSFVENQGISTPKKVIVANPNARAYFSEDELVVIPESAQSDAANLQYFIRDFARQHVIETWYIDTFPVGILGELTSDMFHGTEVHILARRLIWDHYSPFIEAPIAIRTVFQFEELEPTHQAFLEAHSAHQVSMQLSYPVATVKPTHPVLNSNRQVWLVVHTSSEEELQLLIAHAKDLAVMQKKEPVLVILTDLKLEVSDDCIVLSEEHPQHWYGVVDKIFTAAGFNTWYELSNYRDRHICLPFPRKYDDQFWRCQQV